MAAAVPAAGKRSLTDPQALARLRGVTLRARRVVDGVLQGLHKSPHQGASIEFAEHKEYAPGDEIRHVDWKAFARFDKYYVKKYEQETNLQAFCVLDASASMGYGADGTLTKFEYAGVMITTLAYLLLRQQDAVGLVKYAGEVMEVLPPRSRLNHLTHLTTSLETTRVKGGTNLEAGLEAVVEFSKKRGLVFVFSDFFSDSDKPFNMLRHLVGRGHQVTVFHVLDGDELTFPFERMTLFEGMESTRRLLVEPQLVRRAYLKRIAEHQALIRKRCLDSQVGYQLVDTREAPGEIVLRYLRANGPSKAGG
ncbi:MAG: DUF58 domain-containing protein [Deltaproteobacteria bacterium HGW-Deltaproteobacteria-14]|nr:MAG: DUF58 domain-containing protein [Deltaproteobacteria bacterium HGW-Deltaproteobacteria-14]